MSIEERLKSSLFKRYQDGNLRSLKIERSLIDFFSNDYLGLARNKELQERVEVAYSEVKNKISGATGSRLLSGNSTYYQELEARLSILLKGESALVFNSGYTANLAAFSSIPQKGDTIIYDELIHTCIKEGSRLSFADRFSFRHNDVDHLELKLKKAKGEKFIAIETVYSMDGDMAPLREIISLAKKYNAYIITDEAHGTGVFGKGGSGVASEYDLHQDLFIRVYTFGKAIGSHGACVVASKTVTDYLINFSRPFIYTTALPLHNLLSIDKAFDFIKEQPELQIELFERIDFYRKGIAKLRANNQKIVFVESKSPIQTVIVSGNAKAKALSAELIKKGFDVRPILYPTVPQGKERVRICLHVYNSLQEIQDLLETIKDFTF
jgi:8-amino-7-oxononanoate synthase